MTPAEKKCKNLVYLMLKRYKTSWRHEFPRDMNLPIGTCEKMMEAYGEEVAREIDEEREQLMNLDGGEVPPIDSITANAIKRINLVIATCEDPGKIARTIQVLEDIKKNNAKLANTERSIFDKLNNNEDGTDITEDDN